MGGGYYCLILRFSTAQRSRLGKKSSLNENQAKKTSKDIDQYWLKNSLDAPS